MRTLAILFMITVLNCAAHAQAVNDSAITPIYKISPLKLGEYKGKIKFITRNEYEKAIKKNNRWVPGDSGYYNRSVHLYDEKGFLKKQSLYYSHGKNVDYLGHVSYSYQGDTLFRDEVFSPEGEVWVTSEYTYNSALNYTYTQHQFNGTKTEEIYTFDKNYQKIETKGRVWDSLGMLTTEYTQRYTYAQNGNIYTETVKTSWPEYPSKTITYTTTKLNPDSKGNTTIILFNTSGSTKTDIIGYEYEYYDE